MGRNKSLTMKVAIRKAGGPFGTRTSLGAYAAVAVAVGKLTRKLYWKSPRRAEFEAEDGRKVRVTLLLFQKGTNDFATDVWARLTAAGLGSDLAIDVCSEIVLPSQKVEEVWLEGVSDPPGDVIGWAVKNGWQVEEEPGPGRFWNSM